MLGHDAELQSRLSWSQIRPLSWVVQSLRLYYLRYYYLLTLMSFGLEEMAGLETLHLVSRLH